MRINKNRTRGFTLVELVIVLVILAILVGVALPTFMGVRSKAYRAEALGIMNEIKAMAWCYRLQYGNTTYSAWQRILPGDTPDGGDNSTVFRAIGYSTSDIPTTNNFEFIAHIRGETFVKTWHNLTSPGGDCDYMYGSCFIIEARPKTSSAAERAGSPHIWLVMNRSSATTIGYTQE